VLPLIEQRGHSAIALDLPAHGKDTTPIESISLDSYVDRVSAALDQVSEPAILVGHSMAGVVITQAAERWPDKIKLLVYLCAFLPRNGETLLQLAGSDPNALIVKNLVPSADQRSVTIRDEAIREIFYADCSDKDAAWAQSMLTPEPVAPLATPIAITGANFGRVPRVYIECLQDNAIPHTVQQAMYTASPCRQVLTLDTSHSPFISAPNQLVEQLASLS
jgi:pimeloyl-ACP methyl ester carboxylesterase